MSDEPSDQASCTIGQLIDTLRQFPPSTPAFGRDGQPLRVRSEYDLLGEDQVLVAVFIGSEDA